MLSSASISTKFRVTEENQLFETDLLDPSSISFYLLSLRLILRCGAALKVALFIAHNVDYILVLVVRG